VQLSPNLTPSLATYSAESVRQLAVTNMLAFFTATLIIMMKKFYCYCPVEKTSLSPPRFFLKDFFSKKGAKLIRGKLTLWHHQLKHK